MATSSQIDGRKWMSSLPDQLKLNQITLPGTHDSCAHSCSVFAQCQQLSLADQLIAGVRFIDVRCRHINDRFELYHSSFSLGGNFDTGVLEPCVRFLQQNPSEALLMLVSPEYKAKNNRIEFDDLFLSYIEPFMEFWHLDGGSVPSLGQSRGKIVLLRRFWSAKNIPFGIDMSGWKHNDTFRIKNCPSIEFFIQDEYKLKADEKRSKVKEVMEKAFACDDGQLWFMNYCSAQNWPTQPPRYIAWSVNKSLAHDLRSLLTKGNLSMGIIVLDFASKTLIEDIFSLNF